jgi:hypothetical protein
LFIVVCDERKEGGGDIGIDSLSETHLAIRRSSRPVF